MSTPSEPRPGILVLPEELINLILRYLSSDHASLAACALTHRSLTQAAQKCAFRLVLLSQSHHAPTFLGLMRASPHLAGYVHVLIIAEPDPLVRWVIPAASDLAAMIDALSALRALAVRCAPTYFDYLGDLRQAVWRASRTVPVRALELSRIAHAPPCLAESPQLEHLRLVKVSFADDDSYPDLPTGTLTIGVPATLELCSIPQGGLALESLQAGRLTRLRVSSLPDELATGLIILCAPTLQKLEIGPAEIPKIRDLEGRTMLSDLHTFAVRGYIDQDPLRRWLRVAPHLRRLILWARNRDRDDVHVGQNLMVGQDILLSGDVVMDSGRALEKVELELAFPSLPNGAEEKEADNSSGVGGKLVGLMPCQDGRTVEIFTAREAQGRALQKSAPYPLKDIHQRNQEALNTLLQS